MNGSPRRPINRLTPQPAAIAAIARQMGRMDIDYAVLEDAFLRYQTKPKLSQHGDLYYEVRSRSLVYGID